MPKPNTRALQALIDDPQKWQMGIADPTALRLLRYIPLIRKASIGGEVGGVNEAANWMNKLGEGLFSRRAAYPAPYNAFVEGTANAMGKVANPRGLPVIAKPEQQIDLKMLQELSNWLFKN